MQSKSVALILLILICTLFSACNPDQSPVSKTTTLVFENTVDATTATTVFIPTQIPTPTSTQTEIPVILPSEEELDAQFDEEVKPLVDQLVLSSYNDTMTIEDNYHLVYVPKTSRLFYVQSILGLDGSNTDDTDNTVYVLYEIARGESLSYSWEISSTGFTQEIIVNIQLITKKNDVFFSIESGKFTGGSGSTSLTNLVDNAVPPFQKLSKNAADVENDLEEIIGYACGIDMSYSVNRQIEAALFTHALASDNWADRYQAAKALGELNPLPFQSASKLIPLMADTEEGVSAGAASTLHKMATDESVFNLLLQEVDNPNADIRYHIANILRDTYPDLDSLADTFLVLLRDEDTMTRQEAKIWLTGYKNPATIPSLIEALQDENPDVRQSAAHVLSEFGPDAVSAIPELARLLSDAEEDVRQAAAYAINNIGDPDGIALTKLIEIAMNESDNSAFSAEIAAISTLSDKETAANILFNAYSSQKNDIREAVCAILNDYQGIDGATDLLLVALKEENEYIRRNAATSLAKMTGEAKRILPELKIAIANEQISDAYEDEITTLVTLGGIESVLSFLQEELQRPEVKMRMIICEILGKYKNTPGVEEVLLIALNDENENVREAASEGLQNIQSASNSNITELYEAAQKETDPDLFIDLVKKIAKSSSKEETLPLLAQALENGSVDFRIQTCDALSDYEGVKGVDSLLVSTLDDQEASVRQAAAEALADLGSEVAAVLPDLIRVVQVENDRDAHYAEIRAIETLSDKESTFPLLETGLQSTNIDIRRIVCRELRGYAGVPGAVELLISAMDDKEYWVRYDAADALYRYDEKALPALSKLLKLMKSETEPNMRVTCAATIGEIGPAASDAIPDLIAMVKNRDDYEKSFAVKALGKIGPLARSAVPLLIHYLDPDTIVNDYDLRPNCIEALELITLQNYGSDVQKWQEWWQNSQEE